MTPLVIRPLEARDRDAWAAIWTAYLAFYETSVPPQMYDTAFTRLLGEDPQDFCGLVAEQDGTLVGLAHYLFHRHGWTAQNTCYLQDLFVDPTVRGTGAGRALIQAVYSAADAQGDGSVYWMTQASNVTARQLYDRIGEKTPFIKYKRV